MNNQQLAATAIHESGHAIAAFKLGADIDFVKIGNMDTEDQVIRGITKIRGALSPARNILFAQAGEASERFIFGVDETPGWRESEDYKAVYEKGFGPITRLIASNRHQLLVLATWLYRKRFLRGAEIEAILKRCLTGHVPGSRVVPQNALYLPGYNHIIR